MRPRTEDEDAEEQEQLRCFVAVLLDPPVLEELQAVQRLLRRHVETGVRWIQPEQMHLTLHFLGDVAASELDDLSAALQGAASPFPPLELCLGGVGVFPERGRPRVIWVGLGGDLEPLTALQRAVTDAVGGFGQHQETKEFHPHLTLGRVRPEPGAPEQLVSVLQDLPRPRAVRWPIGELALMSSDLLPSGARYTVISSVPLGYA